MNNPRISADWSKTKPITPFSCTPRVQEVDTKAKVVHPTSRLLGLGVLFNIVTHRKCIAQHMINPRISADWSKTKPITPFSCTPRVQEVHTKAEVVHLTPGLLGLGVLFKSNARKCIVQEEHTKPEVVHTTPALLGLGVLFNSHAYELYCELYD